MRVRTSGSIGPPSRRAWSCRRDPAAMAGHVPDLPGQVVPGDRGQVAGERRGPIAIAAVGLRPGDRRDQPGEQGQPGRRRPPGGASDRAGQAPPRAGQDDAGRLAVEVSAQGVGQRAGGSEPFARVFLQAFHADGLQLAADRAVPLAGPVGLLLEDPAEDDGRRLAGERRRAGEQREQGRPQSVDVDRGPDVPIAPGLLGRHVLGRAHRLAGHAGGLGRLQRLAQAQVDQVRPVLPVHHDIRGLDVAVHDAAVVGVLHGPGDRLEVGRGPTRVERPALADHPAQAPPVDQPHREEERALDVADLVDRHDVIVLELRQRTRLVAESRVGLAVAGDGRVAPPVGLDQLERDEPACVALERPVDDPHAARPQPFQDHVIAEGPAHGPVHLRDLVRLDATAVGGRRIGVGVSEGAFEQVGQ